MKSIVVYILILLLIAQTFDKWLTIAVFNVNRDYIAKNLCVNRDRPVLKCKGKCQLMKKMKEQEEQEKNSAPAKMQFSGLVLSSKTFYPFLEAEMLESGLSNKLYLRNSGKAIDRTTEIFHPPNWS